MPTRLMTALLFCFFLHLLGGRLQAQDSLLSLPEKYLRAVDQRTGALQGKVDQKTAAYVKKFQKAEEKLLRQLAKKDSAKAAQVITESKAKYEKLQQTLRGDNQLQEYIPSLDTLTTSLKFLSQNRELLAKTKEAQTRLSSTMETVDGLKASLGKAEAINHFLRERKEQLAAQLQGLPLLKEFKRLNKQAYYCKAQVEEYKALLKDQSKWERKTLELLSKTKAFQSFMRKNSQLASLFRLPGGEGEDGSAASLAGLQTRVQVNTLLQERFGSDASAVAQLRENVQAAQGQLNSLKNRAENLKSGHVGNTGNELVQPNFKPNAQKTKSLLQRLEVGTNVQSQKARWMFPVTSDLGLSLGYKLNDKSSVGIGGSYKLGLGTGWQHMAITHQGVGVRSFVVYQLKGSFFLSGGYERNFRSEIKTIEQLKDRSAWQESGLVGLTKKYKVSKKLKGNMQLLWDFLSSRQVPQTQAILFRVGYSLK